MKPQLLKVCSLTREVPVIEQTCVGEPEHGQAPIMRKHDIGEITVVPRPFRPPVTVFYPEQSRRMEDRNGRFLVEKHITKFRFTPLRCQPKLVTCDTCDTFNTCGTF